MAGANARRSLGISVATGMLSSTCLAVVLVPAFFVVLAIYVACPAWREAPGLQLGLGFWRCLEAESMARQKARATSIDAAEVERFSRYGATWWDPRGPMRPLHAMNPARVGWIET